MGAGDAALAARLLHVIEHDIVPKTKAGVAAGNKLFGAAILRKDDLSLVVAETNNEIENPIWHGEMHAIRHFHERPAHERPAAKDCLFLATHEPCSLCLSGITWAGFDNFTYLFSHQDSRDQFAIPHDIRILRAVYAVPDPDRTDVPEDRPLYNRTNAFFQARDLAAMVAALPPPEREALQRRVAALGAIYADLSARYQASKDRNAIPLA